MNKEELEKRVSAVKAQVAKLTIAEVVTILSAALFETAKEFAVPPSLLVESLNEGLRIYTTPSGVSN